MIDITLPNLKETVLEKLWDRDYPTGQKYSLELMFAKFATAKNQEKLNPLTFSSSGAICLKTTLEKCILVKRVHSDWDSNLRPQGYKIGYKSDALPGSHRVSCFVVKKILGWFA